MPLGWGAQRIGSVEPDLFERAGLAAGTLVHREQRQDVRGWRILTRRPFRELAHGYGVECLDWYTCTLPPDVEPSNQDGEVAAFRAMAVQDVAERMEGDEFAVDAAMVLLAAYGSP